MKAAIYREITQERRRQDKMWGGPSHDSQHRLPHWTHFIVEYLNKALRDPLNSRRRLIQAAALCVAAIEAYDRREKQRGA